MDSIKYLLKFLFRLAVLIFVVVIVWWGVTLFYPTLSIRSLLSSLSISNKNGTSTESVGWLPSPRNYQGLFSQGKAKTPSAGDNVYVAGQAFDGYSHTYTSNSNNSGQGGPNANFVTYVSDGGPYLRNSEELVFNNQQQVSQAQTNIQNQNTNTQNKLLVRNISIYQGEHVYSGLSFTGEARDSMFLQGKFPIVMVNETGKAISISYAEAMTNWTVPGWVKFQVKIIGNFPNKTPCTMIFEQARIQNSQVVPVRVRLPVVCN